MSRCSTRDRGERGHLRRCEVNGGGGGGGGSGSRGCFCLLQLLLGGGFWLGYLGRLVGVSGLARTGPWLLRLNSGCWWRDSLCVPQGTVRCKPLAACLRAWPGDWCKGMRPGALPRIRLESGTGMLARISIFCNLGQCHPRKHCCSVQPGCEVCKDQNHRRKKDGGRGVTRADPLAHTDGQAARACSLHMGRQQGPAPCT